MNHSWTRFGTLPRLDFIRGMIAESEVGSGFVSDIDTETVNNTNELTNSMAQGKKPKKHASEGIKLKCGRADCLHEWTFHGKSKFYTICPRCHTSVSVRAALEKQVSA